MPKLTFLTKNKQPKEVQQEKPKSSSEKKRHKSPHSELQQSKPQRHDYYPMKKIDTFKHQSFTSESSRYDYNLFEKAKNSIVFKKQQQELLKKRQKKEKQVFSKTFNHNNTQPQSPTHQKEKKKNFTTPSSSKIVKRLYETPKIKSQISLGDKMSHQSLDFKQYYYNIDEHRLLPKLNSNAKQSTLSTEHSLTKYTSQQDFNSNNKISSRNELQSPIKIEIRGKGSAHQKQKELQFLKNVNSNQPYNSARLSYSQLGKTFYKSEDLRQISDRRRQYNPEFHLQQIQQFQDRYHNDYQTPKLVKEYDKISPIKQNTKVTRFEKYGLVKFANTFQALKFEVSPEQSPTKQASKRTSIRSQFKIIDEVKQQEEDKLRSLNPYQLNKFKKEQLKLEREQRFAQKKVQMDNEKKENKMILKQKSQHNIIKDLVQKKKFEQLQEKKGNFNMLCCKLQNSIQKLFKMVKNQTRVYKIIQKLLSNKPECLKPVFLNHDLQDKLVVAQNAEELEKGFEDILKDSDGKQSKRALIHDLIIYGEQIAQEIEELLLKKELFEISSTFDNISHLMSEVKFMKHDRIANQYIKHVDSEDPPMYIEQSYPLQNLNDKISQREQQVSMGQTFKMVSNNTRQKGNTMDERLRKFQCADDEEIANRLLEKRLHGTIN